LLLPVLKSCRGQIVFLNSSAGVNARAECGQYSATKFALRAIAESLRAEVNAEGVRILNVFPGRTASPMQMRIHKMEGKEYYAERLIQPEDVAALVSMALELPRSVEVTDVHLRPMIKPS
jgi:NADP-dependent 3-hydroxy acid dehydrogenase YdfG